MIVVETMATAAERKDVWASGDAYEPYVGRWSRLVAREFVSWLDVPSHKDWLDVGSGTGALCEVILSNASPRQVTGIDPSEGFVAFARGKVTDQRASFQIGDAQNLPIANSSVIVAAASTPAALAAKGATHTIPIVFFIGTDPVKVGLVKSLARPGGEITGITIINVELIAKSLELAHALMPPAATIGVLVNPANAPQTAGEREIVGNAERTLGRRFIIVTASTPDELEPAFATLVSERVGALAVSGETFFLTQRDRVVGLATHHMLPTIYPYREYVVAGGLISYGTRWSDEFYKLGIRTGRILKGEKAADLPVEQVTKIELAINLKLAKSLNLTIPEPLLGRADEVIE